MHFKPTGLAARFAHNPPNLLVLVLMLVLLLVLVLLFSLYMHTRFFSPPVLLIVLNNLCVPLRVSYFVVNRRPAHSWCRSLLPVASHPHHQPSMAATPLRPGHTNSRSNSRGNNRANGDNRNKGRNQNNNSRRRWKKRRWRDN